MTREERAALVQNTFEAKEVVLGKLFNNDYLFRMPRYQRPYSWTTEEAGELLNDLLGAMSDASPAEPYFLGSIVLIDDPDSSVHEVIDGQQRLTTLTMLFCVLRELASDKYVEGMDQLVRERENVVTGTENRYRLAIRRRDQDFFRENVQENGKIDKFIKEREPREDSRKLIYDNTKLLYAELSRLTDVERDTLSKFVAGHCYVVVVSTYNRDSAHRIFSVLNDRGLDLTPTDILKADVLGDISEEEQDEYTEWWEYTEDEIGREEFRKLFAHIYVIETRNRFHRELAKAFKDDVLSKRDGATFVDETLTPYADAFSVVTKAEYESVKGAEDVNRVLGHLLRLDNDDWVPLAMTFYNRYKDNPENLLALLTSLDRLAYALFVSGFRKDVRIRHYREAIRMAKRADSEINEITQHLELDQELKDSVIAALNEPIYRQSRVASFVRPLLLRLDSMFADAGATYEYKIITVEHVLPQSPKPESEWVKSFSEEERQKWTHRLANLVLLSRKKNTRAQNYEFERKKTEYFEKNDATPFALTTQIVNEATWTPEVLERRQKMLIDSLRHEWHLN